MHVYAAQTIMRVRPWSGQKGVWSKGLQRLTAPRFKMFEDRIKHLIARDKKAQEQARDLAAMRGPEKMVYENHAGR